MIEANQDTIEFFLITIPESYESFEVFNILRYYQLEFELLEDNKFRPFFRQRWGFSKEDEYPLLIVESNSKLINASDASGKNSILTILKEHGFIGEIYKNSVYEK